jgi:hypothetical protein
MSGFTPEIGPDGRPRPRYGEYATPEEQRARIAQPEVTEALSGGDSPAPAAPAVMRSPAPSQSRPGAAAATTATRGSMLDRIATVALLAYGLFIVITSIPSVADYNSFAATFFETLGSDATLADPSAGRGWGLASALVLGVGWLVTALLSWLNLRAQRISFWIPLVGGVVFTMVASALLIVPLTMDPAAWSAIQELVGTTGTK